MGYLTDTSSITTTLQSINCYFSKVGINYISNLERGLTNDSVLKNIEKGFSMLDSIVGYKAPSDEVLSSGAITVVAVDPFDIEAYVNGDYIGSTAFNSSTNQTMTDLATDITNNSGLYTAVAVANVITVSAKVGTGANPNGLPLTAEVNAGTVTSTNFSGGVTNKTDTKFTIKFASSQDRVSSVPTAIGIVGLQTDTDQLYISTGTSAGNWVVTTTDCITLPEVNNIISSLKNICKN